jgi:hypothetical protein
VIERPKWNLTLFKVHFGLLTLKGYTKGEHVLRFEAIVHHTRALHTGRVLEKFPAIVALLAAVLALAIAPDGPDRDGRRRHTHASTATTTTSAPECEPSSITWPSKQPHDNKLSILLRKPLAESRRVHLDTAFS